MKRIIGLLLFIICSIAQAQNVTVTGNVSDSDSVTWANGQINFTLHNNAGGTPSVNGVPLTAAQLSPTANLDGSGHFSLAVTDNTKISPVGTQWSYQICPAATSPCQNFALTTISGVSVDLTTSISSQIQPIRIPASYTARAYVDAEISPLPPAGATYFNLQSSLLRFWNGSVWANFGGGGGAGNPNPPANSIQYANPAVDGFASNSKFTFDPNLATLESLANSRFMSMESVPQNTYDPYNTNYDGGLAAAIAGTSGFTPTQVINATIDYAECQYQMGIVHNSNIRIPLPNAVTLNISQILLWSTVDIGGESLSSWPTLQHSDSTVSMIKAHAAGDALVCSNGTTYHPASGSVITDLIHNVAISGMGSSAGAHDIGIELNGSGSVAFQITGTGNAFGAQGIINDGFQNFIFYAGYPGAQIAGCSSFVNGVTPIANSITPGLCAAVESASIDSQMHFVYATDGAGNLPNHAAGSCYPDCAAVSIGSNEDTSHLFGQVSDIDFIIIGSNNRVVSVRLDASNREAMLIRGGAVSSMITDLVIDSACLDSSLQANYNSNIPTGCFGVHDSGQGNNINLANVGATPGLFGPSYFECSIQSGSGGGSGFGGTYSTSAGGNPDSTSINDRVYCGAFSGDVASGHVNFVSSGPPMAAHNATVNVSGITKIFLATTTPVTHITGGVAGQTVTFTGVSGASIVPGTVGFESISTCTGDVEKGVKGPVTFTNVGGYQDGTGNAINFWTEICNTPNVTPMHVNYVGNPTPSNPSMIDVYGNLQTRQIPNFSIVSALQLHGPPAASGQVCFVQEQVFADNSHVVSSQACSTVDVTAMTPGEIFTVNVVQATQVNLWMISNTEPNAVATGKFPAPTSGFWNYTVIAAGGDGTTPPTTSDNTTGMGLFPWGILVNTFLGSQPACNSVTRGRFWTISGGGTGPDSVQFCGETTGGTFAWLNFATAGSGVTSINGTSGAFTFSGPGVSCTTTSCVFSGGGSNIANVEITVANATTVPPNSCLAAATPVTMTGVSGSTPHSTFTFTAIADYSTVTGWGPVSPGLYFSPWATANTLNYKVCNGSGLSLTTNSATTWAVSAK